MKVAFVMPWHISERGGGAEVQANYLASELAYRGYEVYYICQTNNPKKIDGFGIVNNVNMYWLKPSGRFPWRDQNKYYKPLLKIRPDVIIQRLSSNVNYIIGKYCQKYGAKYYWVCTDNLTPYKDFHVKKFKERYNLKRVSFLKYMIFLMNARIMDYYRNAGMKNVDCGFSQNEFQRKIIKSTFDLQTHNMTTGHPIPENQCSVKTQFKFQTVLWCANFGKHKRPELFIELARHMQHTNLKFIMVGGHNNKTYVNDLLKNKPGNLYCTGQLPFKRALNYFDTASVFVNTSSPEGDGFPNTFVQAWLRSVPIISLGFNPDNIITRHELGYNVQTLIEGVEKLKFLLSDYEIYKTQSGNAYRYGCKNHSIQMMTDNFLNIINHEDTTLS